MWLSQFLFVVGVAPVLAQAPAAGKLWQPSDGTKFAAEDIARLGVEVRPYIRYLDLGELPAEERLKFIPILSAHVNLLSSEPDLIPPVVIAGTQGALLRVNLKDYGWKTGTWEMLESSEPWLHVTLEKINVVQWPGGTWGRDGKHYEPGAFRWNKPVRALAPWLSEGATGKKDLAYLVKATQSAAPMVRGLWFFWQTAIQEGRQPGYADFLGIKDQASFEKLVRFNAKLAVKLEQRRVATFSGITLQPRRVERTATVLGGLWRTFDNELATGKANPLRVLDTDNFAFKATRQFAPLPNGLPAWLLADNKGVRQNKAPDNIVGGDRFGAGNDTRLHLGISCIRCHFMGKEENGIKAINSVPIKKIGALDYDKLRELQRQYLRDLDPLIAQDRAGYTAAIKSATGGMAPQQFALEYQRFYSMYDDARVDAERLAQMAACSKEHLLKALRGVERLGQLDPLLTIVLNGGAIPIRQTEEVISQVMAATRGLILPLTNGKGK